jgi:hypothetical protein
MASYGDPDGTVFSACGSQVVVSASGGWGFLGGPVHAEETDLSSLWQQTRDECAAK